MSVIFELRLAPGPKLLLLALGDNCNDAGYGYPSIATLARKASVSTRTGIRYLELLEKRKLLCRTTRRTTHGKQTSNAYQLNLAALYANEPSANVAPGDPPMDESLSSPTLRGDSTGTQTIIQPPKEPPQQCGGSFGERTPVSEHRAASVDEFSDAAMNAAGFFAFPVGWSSDFIEAIQRLLTDVNPVDSQVLIDELADRMREGNVKHPTGYFRALLKSYRTGNFFAERAHRSAARRETSVKQFADPPTRAAINREVLAAMNEFRSQRKSK